MNLVYKEKCTDCAYLVEGDNGEWLCDNDESCSEANESVELTKEDILQIRRFIEGVREERRQATIKEAFRNEVYSLMDKYDNALSENERFRILREVRLNYSENKAKRHENEE